MQSDGSKRMGFERVYLGRQEPQVEQPLPLIGGKVEVHLHAESLWDEPVQHEPGKQKSHPFDRAAFRIFSVLAGSLAIKNGLSR